MNDYIYNDNDDEDVVSHIPLKLLQGSTPQEKLDSTIHTIIETMFNKAQKGDVQAAKLLLDRALPAPKASSRKVKLPVLYDTNASLVDKAASINNLMAEGKITVEIGASLLSGLNQQAQLHAAMVETAQIAELQERLDSLAAKSQRDEPL
jgi:hypothetical protein